MTYRVCREGRDLSVCLLFVSILACSILDIIFKFCVMADIDNGSSWLNFAKNQVKVSPDAKLSEKFVLPSIFLNFWLFKLQSPWEPLSSRLTKHLTLSFTVK